MAVAMYRKNGLTFVPNCSKNIKQKMALADKERESSGYKTAIDSTVDLEEEANAVVHPNAKDCPVGVGRVHVLQKSAIRSVKSLTAHWMRTRNDLLDGLCP